MKLIFLLICLPSQIYGSSYHYISQNRSALALHPLNWQDSSSTRKQLNLNGEWMALFDEDEAWQRVIVPGATRYKGSILFKRNFIPDSSFGNSQFRLVALGIHYNCQILINKKFIGSHNGGSTSFSLDIEPGIILIGKENEILVQVDTRLDARRTLPVKFQPLGDKNYGGIIRDIFLLAVPKITIDETKIRSKLNPDNSIADLRISIKIRQSAFAHDFQKELNSNEKKNLTYRIELWDEVQKERIITSTNKVETSENTVIAHSESILKIKAPKIWSPKSPFLYRVKILLYKGQALIDEVRLSYGFRDFKLINKNIFLNNDPLYLKGVTWHEYTPDQGILTDFGLIKKNILYLKELGANSVRVAGHPPHPYFSQLCSQYGIVLLQELPVWSVPGSILKQKELSELAHITLKEMVSRDQHQASIMAWGLGGNFDLYHPGTKKFIFNLQEHLSPIDDRPNFIVLSSPDSSILAWPIDIICLDLSNIDDIKFNQIVNRWSQLNTEKATIISFGYLLSQSSIEPVDIIRKENRQRYQLSNALVSLQKSQNLSDLFINSFKDWESECPFLPLGFERNSSLITFGLMNSAYEKRLAFQIAQAHFRGDKRTPIPVVHDSQEQPHIFIIFSLTLILLFLFIYKRERRIRVYISRALFHPHGFFTDIREKRKVQVFDTFFILVVISGILSVITSSCSFFLRFSMTVDRILNLFFSNVQTKAFIIKTLWSPETSLIAFFILTIFFVFLTSLFTKIFGFIVGERVSFSQSITFTIWTTCSYLLLLPLALLFYRLLSIPEIRLPLLAIFGFFHLWYLLRFIRGLKVLYFIPMGRLLLFFCGINLIFWGSLLLYLQHTNAIIDYLRLYL